MTLLNFVQVRHLLCTALAKDASSIAGRPCLPLCAHFAVL